MSNEQESSSVYLGSMSMDMNTDKAVSRSGGIQWGNIITGTLILGVIVILIVGIPVGTAAAKLFGGGSMIWWIILAIVALLVVIKGRFK